MNEISPHCPDYGVEMEEIELCAGGYNILVVSHKNRDGILDSLGESSYEASGTNRWLRGTEEDIAHVHRNQSRRDWASKRSATVPGH